MASHDSSAASSIFSATTPNRMSIASTNTAYSAYSDPGISFMPMHGLDQALNGPDGLLARKKSTSSLMLNSPSKPNSARSTLTAPLPRPSPRQSQSELEAKKKYFCTSCNKGFARKYDWKVHEQRYHEQQKQYPCPDCNVVLHAETLFKSHHRDSHGCQDCNHAKSQEREVEDRRRRTAWGCGFCGELLEDWEKRCDHVSAHYDEGVKRDSWDHSKVILGLLRQEDIDEQWRNLLITKHGSNPNPPLAMRWSKDATGRSHGENSQQLQDLLEFGACTRDPAVIAQMAYDLGLRTNVDTSSATSPPPLVSSESSSTTPVEKAESHHEHSHDSIMASPMTITPENNFQPMSSAMSTHSSHEQFAGLPQASIDIKQQMDHQHHLQQQLHTQMQAQMPQHPQQLQSPIEMHWPSYEQQMMFQQHQQQHQPQAHYAQQHQPMQQMQVAFVDKALPPIPCDASEVSVPTMHSQEAPSIAYDNWGLSASLMGTNLQDDTGMMSATVFGQQHF